MSRITIELDFDTAEEAKQAAALLFAGAATAAMRGVTATAATEPAQKAAAAPKAAAKPAATKKAAPAADEDDSDDDGAEPTLQDAIAKATEAVASGRSADVKKALKAVGADRVSNLKADDVADFLSELDNA